MPHNPTQPLLSKTDLLPHDDNIRMVNEDFPVFGAYTVDHYRNGRCHLFALTMAETLHVPIGVLVDEHAFENDLGEPLWALVHAFCHMPEAQGYLADAKGLSSPEELKDEYLALANEPGELIGDEAADLLTKWLAGGLLEDYLPEERQALERYVRAMHELGLLANAKEPHQVQHQELTP
ncbi:hypothetical protein RBE51_21260 [Pseudomonas taiwanensis]|uniref:hypothetical protein n=1 Tax=Pseudomonas taiwanensis TaxID=470150 RepID=UPI0028DEFBBB|nr:hypothetical protein [Pseudomonas taiwanensis]MDT8925327.1 hypothetical protein [Pseudomonas taiwanensis]